MGISCGRGSAGKRAEGRSGGKIAKPLRVYLTRQQAGAQVRKMRGLPAWAALQFVVKCTNVCAESILAHRQVFLHVQECDLMNLNLTRFAKFAWFYLALNVVVIIWGGIVRATGSGAGCGAHWPTCNGEVIPTDATWHTWVEFSHRMSTGVLGILTIVLVVWALRAYPRGSLVRLGAWLTAFFIVTESAIGAGLVLLELVAYNVSIARAYWMAGHLLNTLGLVGVVTLLAWWASGGERLQVRRQGAVTWSLFAAVLAMFVLGASGAVAALGDTLLEGLVESKEATNLMSRLAAAGVSPAEAVIVTGLVEMRIYHPVIAVVSGVLVALAAWVARTQRPSPATRLFSTWLFILFALQLVVAAFNVALMAPVWIQMVHLLMTNLIWILLVLLAAAALDHRLAPAAARMGQVQQAQATGPTGASKGAL
jgi:heme A synthase